MAGDRAEAHREEVLSRFNTFRPNVTENDAMAFVREKFKDMVDEVVLEVTEPSREQSIALTKLEEAKYWLNQHIARYGLPKPPTTLQTEKSDQ